jgi:hypothetical protein
MPTMTVHPIQDGGVTCDTIVPNHDGARLPLHSSMEIGSQSNVIEQKLEQEVAFLLLKADDSSSELWVYI